MGLLIRTSLSLVAGIRITTLGTPRHNKMGPTLGCSGVSGIVELSERANKQTALSEVSPQSYCLLVCSYSGSDS